MKKKYSPRASALARTAYANRVANGDVRAVKGSRVRLKYAAGPNDNGYVNGVPEGAMRSATRTGLEPKYPSPSFKTEPNPDINSGAFSRLQSQINRTGEAIQRGQARRNPYQSPQRVSSLMNQLGNEENRIGEDRAEAISSGDTLKAGNPSPHLTAGNGPYTPTPRMPEMTPQERAAVSRRMQERPWEDPYHAGGYSAGERAAGLPQSVANNAQANARLRQGIAEQNGRMVDQRVNARLAGRQRINDAAARALGKAEAPPWMQPGAAPPGQPGWTDPIEDQMRRRRGQAQEAPLPPAAFGGQNQNPNEAQQTERAQAFRQAYEQAQKEGTHHMSHGRINWLGSKAGMLPQEGEINHHLTRGAIARRLGHDWKGIPLYPKYEERLEKAAKDSPFWMRSAFNPEELKNYILSTQRDNQPVRESKAYSIPREAYEGPVAARLRYSKEYDPFSADYFDEADQFQRAIDRMGFEMAQSHRLRLSKGICQR